MCAAYVSGGSRSAEGGAAPHAPASGGLREQILAVRFGPKPAQRVARSGAVFRWSVAGNGVVSSRKKRFVLSVRAGMEEAEAGP